MRTRIAALTAVVTLAFVLAGNLAAKDSPKDPASEIVLRVHGMTCGSCEAKVEQALQKIEGVQKVDADHETGRVVVQVSGKVDKSALKKAVEKTGFQVVEKKCDHDHGEHGEHKDCDHEGCCAKHHGSSH